MIMSLEIAAAGDAEFTLGFKLAGVKRVYDLKKTQVKDLLSNKEVGILILNHKDFAEMPEHVQEQVQNSSRPVAVIVSKEGGAEENMRKLIKKSIGVDLWK
jgi:V/A-type H+/Na+-transporting ATPase subunit F